MGALRQMIRASQIELCIGAHTGSLRCSNLICCLASSTAFVGFSIGCSKEVDSEVHDFASLAPRATKGVIQPRAHYAGFLVCALFLPSLRAVLGIREPSRSMEVSNE